jgi:hypothetical protein
MIDIEIKVKGIIFSDKTDYFPYLIKFFRKNNNVAVFCKDYPKIYSFTEFIEKFSKIKNGYQEYGYTGTGMALKPSEQYMLKKEYKSKISLLN